MNLLIQLWQSDIGAFWLADLAESYMGGMIPTQSVILQLWRLNSSVCRLTLRSTMCSYSWSLHSCVKQPAVDTNCTS